MSALDIAGELTCATSTAGRGDADADGMKGGTPQTGHSRAPSCPAVNRAGNGDSPLADEKHVGTEVLALRALPVLEVLVAPRGPAVLTPLPSLHSATRRQALRPSAVLVSLVIQRFSAHDLGEDGFLGKIGVRLIIFEVGGCSERGAGSVLRALA